MLTLLLGLLPFIMVLGNSMLIPILPDLEQSLKLTATETSLILSVFNIPAALVIPFVGFFSDRYGRKKIILFSLLFIFIGGFLCFMSGFLDRSDDAFSLLLVGRVLQGVGTGGTTPLAMALVGDLYTGEKRAKQLAILEVFNGSAKILAPIIGALLALFSWYFPFVVFPLLSIVLIMAISLKLTPQVSGIDVMKLSTYKDEVVKVLKSKWNLLIGTYLLGGIGLFILFGMLYYLSYQIEEIFHIDGFFKGFTFVFPLGALTLTSYWTGKRLKGSTVNEVDFLMIGSIIMLISFFLMIFFQSFSFYLGLLTVGFGGLGFVLPTISLMITSSVNDRERGIVVAFYGVARFGGVALGPIVYSLLLDKPILLFVLSFLLLLFSSFFFWVVRKEGRFVLRRT